MTCTVAFIVRILQSSFAGCFLSFTVASAHQCVLAGCQSEQRGSLISCLVLNTHTSTHRHTDAETQVLLWCTCFLKSWVFSSEDAAFLCPTSRVSSAVPPLPVAPSSSLLLKFSPSPAAGKLSLHQCPHPYKLHTSQASLFFFPDTSVSLSLSLSIIGRPCISQGSILSLFPNRIILPCCQTGFSEVPITASCFKNRSLGSYCNAHTKPSGYFSPILLLFVLFRLTMSISILVISGTAQKLLLKRGMVIFSFLLHV